MGFSAKNIHSFISLWKSILFPAHPFGNQAGCKYENSVIDLTNAQGGSFLSSELSAIREEKDKQDIDSFIWEYANSMEKQPV